MKIGPFGIYVKESAFCRVWQYGKMGPNCVFLGAGLAADMYHMVRSYGYPGSLMRQSNFDILTTL